jgi:hypothetical protein
MLGGDVTTTPLVSELGVLRVRAVMPDPDLLERYAVSSQETSS